MPAVRSHTPAGARIKPVSATIRHGDLAGTNLVAVVGPTAAGKSDLAVELALRLGGEIVNADSMQLYRGMDVGTAKLGPQERRGVPHHLLDVWDVTETASVADYQRMARETIAGIHERGRVPLLVGGSGLYIRAVIDDLDFPGTDPELRARLESSLAEVGPERLHVRLASLDPAAAASILPSDGRRVVRALEVIEMTGRPFSASMPSYDDAKEYATQLALTVPRPELDERIALRVDRMWSAGLVEEVRRLEPYGLREGFTASRALGYAQVLGFLAGEWSEERAREEIVRSTRSFARRQESWFRRDPRVRWIDYRATAGQALDTIDPCDS